MVERGNASTNFFSNFKLEKWGQDETKTSNNFQDKVALNSKWLVTLIYVLTFRIPKLLFSKIVPPNATSDI